MSNHLPQCDCGRYYPGQGHPPDCPVRQAFEVLQSQLAEALKPKVCRWRERMGTGETEHIPSCPQFKKAGISQAHLCPIEGMHCIFCGGEIEKV